MYSFAPSATPILLNTGGRGSIDGTPGAHNMRKLCVIVEKDSNGYGLTVSGDKPVHVQKVKEDGASARAGVKEGDRILMVNGSLVSSFDHTEVVNLIKSGSHVSLTLLRKSDTSNRNSTSKLAPSPTTSLSVTTDRVGAPIPANAEQEQQIKKDKVETMKKFLTEAIHTEDKLTQEYNKNKSGKNEQKLQEAQKTVESIKKGLEALTGVPSRVTVRDRRSLNLENTEADFNDVRALRPVQSLSGLTSRSETGSPSSLIGAGFSRARNLSFRVKRSNSDTAHGSNARVQAVSVPGTSLDVPDSSVMNSLSTVDNFSTSPPYHDGSHRLSLNDTQAATGTSLTSPSSDALEIIDMEDDEFVTDSHHIRDHGPFKDLDLLKNRPAHCSVFLNFLISNGEPGPLLFTLIADMYRTGNIRDMKRWAYEIHSTFLIKDAPLSISRLADAVVSEVEATLSNRFDKEEYMKNVFNVAKMNVATEINEDLFEFRNKRVMGLGMFFGDDELKDEMDRNNELKVIEKTLRPHFDRYAAEEQSPRSQALSSSLATIMKEWGVSKGGLDRQTSFMTKESKSQSSTGLKNYITGTRQSKKKETKGHFFAPHSYSTTTYCDICNILLWGAGCQGWNCHYCDMNVNKDCLSKVAQCKRTHKDSKKNGASKRISLFNKQSSENKNSSSSAVNDDSLIGSPNSNPANEDKTAKPEEDTSGHSVADLAKRFEGDPSSGNSKPDLKVNSGSDVRRAESFKTQKKSVKDKNGRTRSDGDKTGPDVLKAIQQSHSSSSTSSLSNKSDSSSTEKVNQDTMTLTKPVGINEADSDLEVEDSLPSLDSVISKDIYRKMKPKEKKLQEIINEFVYTERSHVRNLKLLDILFHQPMRQLNFYSENLVDLVFPDLGALIQIHVQLNNALKDKMKENPCIGMRDVNRILLDRFDGKAGDHTKTICANFCRNHTYALKVLAKKRKSDVKTHDLFNAAESNPQCRRLQFKDLVIAEVHRLTKYPLLFQNMKKYVTPNTSEDYTSLEHVIACSRKILDHVNSEVKECENHHKLEDLQTRLDLKPLQNTTNTVAAEYKNLLLTEHKLVYEGSLTWKSNNKHRPIDIHGILLEDILVLTQVQDDNKLVLKCQSHAGAAGKEDSKYTAHSPIIPLKGSLCRPVATDKKAFFMISTINASPLIYELTCNTMEEKKRWFKYITDTAQESTRGTKASTERRAPVNKFNLTLNETITDESTSNGADNNNVEQDDLKSVGEHLSLVAEGNDLDSSTLKHQQNHSGLSILDQDFDTSVEVTSELDTDQDVQSLLLASITDTNMISEMVSLALSPTASAPSPAASPNGSMTSLTSASSVDTQRLVNIAQTLQRRLRCILDVVRESESENRELREKLRTAETLLASSKSLSGSRPQSFISTTSSMMSDTGNSTGQVSAEDSVTAVALHQRAVSDLENEHDADIEDHESSSEREDNSDSDDGTVREDNSELTSDSKTLIRDSVNLDDSSVCPDEELVQFVVGTSRTESLTDPDDCEQAESSEEGNTSSNNNNLLNQTPTVDIQSPTSESETESDITEVAQDVTENSGTPAVTFDFTSDLTADVTETTEPDEHIHNTTPDIISSVRSFVDGIISSAVDLIHKTEIHEPDSGGSDSDKQVTAAGDALCPHESLD